MKKRLLIVAVFILSFSCASTPYPEGPDDSLVIGYLALDFPDGFFEQNRRTITSGITLTFVNQASGRKFGVTTSNGYFQFLSNGTDSYNFASYKVQSDRATIQSSVNKRFDTKPHSVVYLGHLTVIYSKPKQTHRASMDLKTRYWNYETSAKFDYSEEQLRTHLEDQDPESLWLEYEVVR